MINETAKFQILGGDPSEIESLAKQRGGIRASIYLPVSHDPPESDQNPIRLRSLIEEAGGKLRTSGASPEKTQELLEPLASLASDPRELLVAGRTLAFFVDLESASLLELPYEVGPSCRVGNRFAIKPLLPLLQWNPTYTAICINRGDVRAFRGNRTGIEAVTIPDMPEMLEDVTGIDDPEKSLQHHTARTASAEGRPGSAPSEIMHGQGLPSDLEDSQLERFFREVSKAVHADLSGREDTLILFGVDENIGRFKSVDEWKERQVIDKAEDPQRWDESRVREEAWQLLEPHAKAEIESRLDQLREAENKGSGVFRLIECAVAAAMGRIETVAVAMDREVDGICDVDNMEVKIIADDDPACALDLYDFIASETIRHGGEVFGLEGSAVPGEEGVAATVRF